MTDSLSNPATYLFLNPILQARRLALDVEDATHLWNSGNPYARSLPTSLPDLPVNFDPLVYMAENRDIIDISTMNQVIFQALSNEGRDLATVRRQASYHGTIFRPATLTAPNTFAFTDYPSYALTACNMSVSDMVKISVNSNQEHIYGTVSSVSPSGFAVSPPKNTSYTDDSATYIVYGLRLYDAERLCLANLARAYDPVVPIPYAPPLLEKEFNVDLYHVLYPDTRTMSQSEAYVDYTDNWGAASYRITKAGDLLNIRAPGITYANLSVDGTLNVGKGLLVANGTSKTVTVNGPLVGRSLAIGACNLFVSSTQFVVGCGALSVTSQTLVSGVQASFASNVSLGSGASLTVGGDSTFQGSATVLGDTSLAGSVSIKKGLDVALGASFDSNVSVAMGLEVGDDVRADRMLALTAIGIGSSSSGGPVPPSTGVSGGGGGGGGGGGPVPDPLIVGTVIAGSTVYVGAGPWMVTDTESTSGALTLHHPSMGDLSHVFDPSGRVGLNVAGWGGTAMEYGLVANGDIFTTGSVVSQSDARFKSDLKIIDSPMQRLSGMTGYTYLKSDGGGRSTGVLAQDVRSVLPEAVRMDADGVMSVAYGNLAGLFVEALKQMHIELQELRQSLPCAT